MKPVTSDFVGAPAAKRSMSKRKGAKRRRLAAELAGKLMPAAIAPSDPAEMPYRAGARVLVLGDGDFSWSRALAGIRGGEGIVATVFDSEEDACRKYGELFKTNAQQLALAGATVLCSIDATSVDSCERLTEWRESFDNVVFNFPHAAAGLKDEAENTRLHRALIRSTLRASTAMLSSHGVAGPGQVHVTLRRGRPYCEWAVPSLAEGLRGLRFVREFAFDPKLYPGYQHRRTRGLAQTRPDAAETWLPNSAVTKGEGSVTYCFARCSEPTPGEPKHVRDRKRGRL